MKDSKLKKASYFILPAEKMLLDKYCKENNIKASHLIRNLVLEKIGLPYIEPIRIDVDFVKYLNELTRNANNLNQVARKLNSGLKLELWDEEILNEQILIINNQINEIRKKY